MRTQVGIVGAGPAGLMLSHLLHLAGIESIIVEDRSREYCENRVRAGLMENWVSQMLIDTGVGARMQREAMVHDGIFIAFNGAAHKLDFPKLIDKHVYIYDQKEVVTDLIAKRLADGGQILFEVAETSVHDFTTGHAEDPLQARRQGAGDRLRFHRRLRRLSRRLPAEPADGVRGKATTASIRSAGSAFCRNRRRRSRS